MEFDADALVIGAGPAGSATAILLASAGWRVTLVEQHEFPRQKVCGECISAGSLALLDALGIGREFRARAGPELRRVGWIGRHRTIDADFPPCEIGRYSYGRAIGRDVLDSLLLERARALGVEVVQPAKVRSVHGRPGDFECDIKASRQSHGSALKASHPLRSRRVRVVIDAHGSWESGPTLERRSPSPEAKVTPRDTDLFAFKVQYSETRLMPGLLPVIAVHGGYGGIVVADAGRTTLACCIRRDILKACRAVSPGLTAGEAVAHYLGRSCAGLQEITDRGRRVGSWLSVGPIRPGVRVDSSPEIFRVGNAAGETHPLIGEGISMALQSASLLTDHLLEQPAETLGGARVRVLNARYAAAWRGAFMPRLRFARAYAQAAMLPSVARPLHAVLQRWPALLTRAARWAGKAQAAAMPSP